MSPRPVIAVDGPAASGKGTLARGIANVLGFAYLDTGLIYRAVGARMLDLALGPDDIVSLAEAARHLTPEDLARTDLRTEAVGGAASVVAAIPEVRDALLAFQRDFAAAPPIGRGAVIDGRDIGTVICPDADLKLFVDASVEVRADRRFRELQALGKPVIYSDVLQDLKLRDERDRNRTAAPLKPAADAVQIDTSDMDAAQAFSAVLDLIRSRKPALLPD